MKHVKKPVILVTGASRGLGRGIAQRLSKDGFSVIINYAKNIDAAEETAELCESVKISMDQRFLPLKADIRSKEERERLVESAIRELGRIDALVNNAGISPKVRADILDASEESFEELIQTNLQGPYFLTQAVANYWLSECPEPLLEHGFKIIFVTSISADTASVNRGEYCISKAGLAMASRLWAARLAEKGIQVFELRPGIMETDMTRAVHEKYDELIAGGLIPQMRWGMPDDLGKAVSSIMQGSFPFSTGSIIHIDGGFHISRL